MAAAFLAHIAAIILVGWNGAGVFDTVNFEFVGRVVLQGGNIYSATRYYNYAPPWAFIVAALLSSGLTPFYIVLRAFLGLASCACAVLVGRLYGGRAMWIWLGSPLVMLTVGIDGQYDLLAAIPLLCAMLMSHKGHEHRYDFE